MQKKLTLLCTRLIFKRSLRKLAAECKVTFSNSLYLQSDEFTMGGSVSVAFSDIYMVKTRKLHCRTTQTKFMQDMSNRRKFNTMAFFERLNNHHTKIKLTIELNSRKDLDTNLICVNGI